MAAVKWIKLTINMFEDEKIRLIESMPDSDSILIIWIKLLTLAGKCNAGGYIFLTENIPYTDEMLATVFNKPLNTVRLALETFKRFGMINLDENNSIKITNWEKHQNVDGLDKIREQTRKRVAKHREKQKLLNNDVTSNVTVTQSNAIEEDIDKDIDKEKENKKKKIKYAEFVSMTEDEYNKLIEKHGEESTKKMIEILDNYKGSKGKKYKSDYRAILSWVVDKVVSKSKEASTSKKEYCGKCSNGYIFKPIGDEILRVRCECNKGD
ncbi:phage replisome organizer N-terminal domain-containing protein [Tepidibacter formicigenes]|jgi:predicted phage replisome organizer|uniref:Phage replisome organizer, putative, N-terminal region n=1 Tax=Tepidibacter formicigenes DSM 15518 TaxID=1123349 RepID=A0A1M6SMZ4_9FIRM|nr:phage replisome organizer N-terminal domain-containing protein [Tepidibacter formicigenes]SHK45968.1 phage replisome organizer, putative, N-terminal region [Tepidibacter formicigenes DSM 15518]